MKIIDKAHFEGLLPTLRSAGLISKSDMAKVTDHSSKERFDLAKACFMTAVLAKPLDVQYEIGQKIGQCVPQESESD